MHNAEHAIVGQIESDLPIVMQHTHLNGLPPTHARALLTTAAFGAE